MKIFIASDHAGFELKRFLIERLSVAGYDIKDMGPKSYDPEDDYPDFIGPLAREVSCNPSMIKGIVIGGSGQGESIAANKFYGIRSVVYYGGNIDIVSLAREHNDSNVLALGSRFLSPDDALRAVNIWLTTPFSGDERHRRRIQKLFNLNKELKC